jgi:F-type H+-transporting ATPase subunit delta
MNEGKIITRYAKSVFSLAKDKNIIEKVYSDMEQIIVTYHDVPDFKTTIEIPVITPSQKIELFNHIFKNSFNPVTISFVELVIKNRREIFLSDMARVYLDIYRNYKGIKTATLTTAVGLDEATRQTIIQTLKNFYKNSEIILKEYLEEKILGGFILNIDDRQFDASTGSNLTKIKRTLKNTTIK